MRVCTYNCVALGLSMQWSEQKKNDTGNNSAGSHAGRHGVKKHGDEVGLNETVIESHRAYNRSCF